MNRLESLEPTVYLLPEDSHTITIPFRLINGHIIVKGYSGGKSVQCLIDTGSSDVEWSDALGLTAKATGVTFEHYNPYYTLAPRSAQWMLLKELRIGSMEIHACPGLAYSHLQGDDNESNIITVGNSVFAHFIVTIDYQKHNLLIGQVSNTSASVRVRTLCPSISVQHHLATTYMLNFKWRGSLGSNPLTALGPGQVLLAGSIGGHSATIGLDTGAGNIGLAVKNTTLNNLLLRQFGGSTLSRSSYGIRQLSNVEWNVGDLYYRGLVLALLNFQDNGPPDAMMGTQVLECYKVTINYPARKVLLKWNILSQHSPIDTKGTVF